MVAAEKKRGPLRWVMGRWHGVTAGVDVALGALLGNKFRAAMTALGIVIGVMTVTGILSIIHGLDQGVEKQMALMGTRSIYISDWPWIVRGDWYKYVNRPPITDWQYRRLKEQVPFAEDMAPIVKSRSRVSRGAEQVNDVRLRGTSHAYLAVTGESVGLGRFLSAADVRYARPFVVLGSDVAKQLFPQSNPLGEYVRIGSARFQVIGVLRAQGSFLGRSQDITATMPIGRFRRDFGTRRSMEIAVAVSKEMSLEKAASELEGIMRRVRGLRPVEEDNFSVNQQEMLSKFYDEITGTLYLVIIIISLISLLVGGIGIMNIMLVSVTERTREIGLRKALGARRLTILFQFLIESLVLSGLGGLIGLAAGFGVAYVVDSVSALPAHVSVEAIVAGLGFSAMVGMFFGIWPAWMASRLDPIVALRSE